MLAAKEALPSARDMADQLNLGNDHGFVFKRGRPITSRASKCLDSLSKKNNSSDKTQQISNVGIPPKSDLATTARTVSEPIADIIAKTPVRKRPAPPGSPMIGGSGLRLDFPEPKRRLTASPLALQTSGQDTTLQTSASDTSEISSKDLVKEISVPVRKLPQPTPLISRTRTRVFETPVARSPIGSKVGIHRRSGAGVRRTTTALNDNAMGGRQQQRRAGRKSTMGKRRRSTFSMRGKRASSIGGGFKALPHDSVDAADFYRHISPELPEPIRLRQLLAWCARRTSAPPTWPDDLPEAVKLLLSDALREAVDDIHSAFERGEIATSWYHRPIEDEQTSEQSELLPHPENKANLEAKERLSMRISKLRSENDGWVQELKRASTLHAKALDRLPKSLQTLPMHQEKDLSNIAQTTSVEPISRALGSIDWSALDDAGLQYIDEANDEVIDVELDNAESQIDQAVQEIEIQLDSFHLDMHRSNEITKEARRKCEYQQRDLGFILEQRRARAMVVAKSLGSIPVDSKLNTQSIKTEQTDPTRDLLRALAASLSGQ